MPHFIAIDLGTTNCKAVVIDETCNIIHTNKIAVNSILEDDGTHEQNAEEIFHAVIKLLQQYLQNADKNKIACVSFSAAMHSFMAVDTNGKPLMNAMTWADTRSKKYAIELRNSEPGKKIYSQTGTPVHAMSPLCKLLWLKNEKPEIFNGAYKFISIKEYIYSKFFNKYIIDEGIACCTGLYDIYNNKWNAASLQLAGIDESKLSTVVATTHYETELLAETKLSLGLAEDIPFVMGGNDGCLANFGCGALSNDTAVLTLGTSGAVRLTISKPQSKELNGLFRYILTKEVYVTGGPINNGGIVLEWFAKNFLNLILEQDDNFNKVMKLAAQSAVTCEGLLFLPYMLGERAPVWDENACGIFYDLKMNHEKQHLSRAVIEGISFSLLQILNNIEQQNNVVDAVYVSGFVTNSEFWLQLLADMFGKKIILNEVADASAVGAALIGMYATGFIKNVYEVKKFLKTDKVFVPNETNYLLYQKHFERYKKLYSAFKMIDQNESSTR